MLFLIDGVDRTGKTTLAQQLCAAVSAQYVHRGPPGDTPSLVHHGAHLADFRAGSRWVLDRNHWSDLAYGPVYRPGGNVLSSLAALYLDLVLEARGAVAILGSAGGGPREIASRMAEYGEDFLQPQDVWAVWETFEKIATETPLPLYPWDFADPAYSGEQRTKNLLDRAAERACEVRLPLQIAHEVVGWTTLPTHLLVGDRVTGSDQHNAWGFKLPFAPVPGTSGAYLWMHLEPSVREGQARPLLVNAVDSTGEAVDLRGLHRALGAPPTVALGEAADAALSQQHVPHGAVPHPQYVRHFKHPHGGKYAQALYRAAENEGDLRPWITSL